MAKSRIYTRKGDDGYTSLVSGNRVLKSDIRLDVYGTIDEFNSFIACLIDEVNDREDRNFLLRIQSNLFILGGYFANDEAPQTSPLPEEEVDSLEEGIDSIDELLPPLKAFILPGGSKGSSMAHVCRTVCRRAERLVYRLKEETEIDPIVLKYINRLSDYFFLFARKQNFLNNVEEIIWENPWR